MEKTEDPNDEDYVKGVTELFFTSQKGGSLLGRRKKSSILRAL